MTRILFTSLALCAVINLALTRAQDQSATTSSHASPVGLPPVESVGEVVRFSQLPTSAGDRLTQKVGMELELRTVITQSGQVAHDSTMSLRRRQERNIEVLQVDDGGHARRAKVTFSLSRLKSPQNPTSEEEVPQVVEGRSYLITRSGDQLLITDKDGAIPTREEFELVLKSMESFGQPNLLAQFLLAQDVHLGDTLQVPPELAAEMMGLDQLGSIERFELKLNELKEFDGKKCAVFVATITAQGSPVAPLGIETQGTVVIDLATTRTVEATLSGPLSMHANEQDTQYQASGKVLLAIRSFYSISR